MSYKYAHVITGLPVDGHFDYAVPGAIREHIAVGSRVRIPFGNTRRIGVVVNLTDKSPYPRLKEVQQLMDSAPSLDAGMLALTRELSAYYGCSWGEAVDCVLPSSLRKGRKIELHAPVSGGVTKKNKPRVTLIHEKDIEASWNEVNARIDRTLSAGRAVIILVPEVSWIAPARARIKDYFEEDPAVLDKRMKTSEELEHWLNIREGRSRIALGTRSCVFAPFSDVGLIVVFDEADDSYKQEQSPHYHAAHVAEMRAHIHGSDVVFVSHCPSAGLWKRAEAGEIERVSCGEECAAHVQMVDLTNYKMKRTTFISPPLENEITAVLNAKGRVMLFLNRKGDPVSTLEAEVHRRFPAARVIHFDKENRDVPPGANFIIATQAVFSSLHKVAPDLIAVLRFDSELSWNDYRSSHRAFSLLVYLNRFARKKVIAQSYNLDNYAVRTALKMDFDAFYREELKLRRELSYPPFKHLVTVSFRGEKEPAVNRKAAAFFDELKDGLGPESEAMEPHPELFEQLKDRTRLIIIVKTPDVKETVALIKRVRKSVKVPGSIIMTIDVE